MMPSTMATAGRLAAAGTHLATAPAATTAQQAGVGAIHQCDDEQRHGDRRESNKLLHAISLRKETETEKPCECASIRGRNVAGIAKSVYKIGNVQRVCGHVSRERAGTYNYFLFQGLIKFD
jgi:hypothetical protein